MRIFVLLVFAFLTVFAQTEFDFPEPLDVVPLTDEQAAELIVELVTVEPIKVPVIVVEPIHVRVATVELAEVLLANVQGISVATVDLICRGVMRMGVQTVDVAMASIVARAIESINPEPVSLATGGSLQTVINAMSVSMVTPEAVQIVIAALEAANCRVVSPGVIAVALRQIAAGRVQARAVDVTEITPADRRIPEIQAFWKKCAEIFADQRMVGHDSGLNFDSPAVAKWLAIYERPIPPAIQLVPLPYNIRMIAELRLTESGSIPSAAEANLAVYAKVGYNACLITVYGHESPDRLLALASLIRSAGMAPWFAWAGPESLSTTIFHDPDQIARLLAPLARVCEGYIGAWRRTSAHLVEQDPQYLEHIVAVVRKANPSIPIVGESYYGQTWQNAPHVAQAGWQARDNTPRNPSGILIAGIATRGYNIENMLATTFARWQSIPRLGLILGERPYYASSASNGRTWRENLQIKQELERRFLRAGCQGTITIHGDGSDRGAAPQASDNLGEHNISKNNN
ncbi:MAG: hypothetical protein WCT05_06750 [Lentisphaeria bacterium]